VNDPVDRVIIERQRTLDVGFRGGMLTSLVAHLVTVGLAFAAPLVFPKGPPLKVADGFAVVLPRGGGGSPDAGGSQAPPPPVETPPPQPQPEPEPPAPEPPKVLKPPKEEPKQGLPELDSRKKSKKPDKPTPRAVGKPDTTGKAASAGTSQTGPGSRSGTPGLAIGPPGPGVPDGTDTGGDWYLAGVQQKIWSIWTRQLKTGFTRSIGVTFTILADGSVTDVQVTEPSGVTLLDLAAQRAILTAAPFGPLPRTYDTNRKTIQALFQPTQ
jgi:protein TonB